MAIGYLNNSGNKNNKTLMGIISRSLTELVIPKGIESIGSSAFADYAELEKVVFLSNITSIGNRAFAGCSSCKIFDFSNSTVVPTIASDAFENISSACEFIVPAALTEEWKANESWSGLVDNITSSKNLPSVEKFRWYIGPEQLWKSYNVSSSAGKALYMHEGDVPFTRVYGNGTSPESYYAAANASNIDDYGKYLVFSYRLPTTNSETYNFEIYSSTQVASPNENSKITIEPIKDGKWHIVVVDVPAAMSINQNGVTIEDTFTPDANGGYPVKLLRADFLNAKLSTESYIDIGYIGFCKTLEDALAVDTDYDTLTFDAIGLKKKISAGIESIDTEHNNMPYIRVNYTGSGEQTTMLKTTNNTLNTGLGNYIGILCRTSFDNYIEVYASTSNIKAEYNVQANCGADGEWHFMILNIDHANYNPTFARSIRFDYLNGSKTDGEYIDVGLVKFFATNIDAKKWYNLNYAERYNLEILDTNGDLEYALNSGNKSYSVTGMGEYKSSDVIIPSTYNGLPVTSVGKEAFKDHYTLKSIVIPDSVTSIGSYAFSSCWHLESVVFSESSKLTSIHSNAFADCSRLRSITIPDSVTSIGEDTFARCLVLTSIVFSENSQLTSIGDAAFFYCSSLKSITIPNSVTSIGGSAFSGCTSLESITIPDSVTSIGTSAFNGCYALTSITIPNSVTSIDQYTFSGCSGLKSITIPDSVTSIVNEAFRSCSSLESITIPNSVTYIGDSAFRSCSRLTSIVLPSNIRFKRLNADVFRDCTALTSINIPDSVTEISSWVFYNCTSLENIIIPESVTAIGSDSFYNCSKIIQVENKISYVDKWVIKCESGVMNATLRDNTQGIAGKAFSRCSSLTSINIPESVRSISHDAFSGCSKLTSVVIPASVINISARAFKNCSSLTSITIPDSVTSIGNSAFYGCSSITLYDFSSHTSIPTLSTKDVFDTSAPGCQISVPASLYDEWITKTNWTYYADYINAV